MKFTTHFELHSQTTRLYEGTTQGLGIRATDGVLTLHDLLFQGNWTRTESVDASSAYNSDGRPPDFKLELFPVHSPLLRESLLVSVPRLIDMLKFRR
jgi:hypothetical protein